ncbi:hypothetical protein [Halarsenatibacter silvermanii]|uniref:Polysaccharide deacetylase n=1 Tax=Halarsenatibacter silvermanii TaxID=321763 RepID=A0A1G9SA50_9FIRM|nr:hypothetical protein [Halarsenatibacter silvermanii]SDM32251.1 hypothetical protein SAMN04488692_12713 [Halarsenatibacter silvermanii]
MSGNGKFIISLDTELAWGTVDKPESRERNSKYYYKTRDVIEHILNLFAVNDITATWAVIGHLFLAECREENGIKHPEIKRSEYDHYDRDWFAQDPATNIEQDPTWYGRDIIEKIKACPVKQEIASHSFAHILYGHPFTKKETVRSDLIRFEETAEEWGVESKSFVFPRNMVGHLPEIERAGFKAFRGSEPSWYEGVNKYFKKVCHMFDQFFALTPPVVEPQLEAGLVNIPASMLYLSMDSFRKYIPISARIKKAKKGINAAIQENKIFHLWFHPFNIATAPDKLISGLEKIISYADKKRGTGKLEIKTIGEVAEQFLGKYKNGR